MNPDIKIFRHKKSRIFPILPVIALLFSALVLGLQLYTGGYATDRGNHGDEAAHFVSSLGIADYLANGHFSNPVAFAKDYYAHFPKLAIGHWPPVFETLQAGAFLIFGGSGKTALALQAAIAILAASLTAGIAIRLMGIAEGIAAGLIVLLSPVFLAMVDTVMADNLLAITFTLTALCWSRFYSSKQWRWGICFALAAAASILTKGTGFGLALLPVIYLVMKRDIAFLFNGKTLCCGALVACLTLPWYVLTYKMAADGFVFSWGWSYTSLALPFFLKGLPGIIGLPLTLAYIAGIYYSFRHRTPDIATFSATSLALIIFVMLAPADLDRRYLIPALPSVAIVALWGLTQIAEKLFGTLGKWPAIVLAALSMAFIVKMPHVRSFGSGAIAEAILSSGVPNHFVLISGSVEAEGAVVSSFAERDPHKTYYVIRAQKALAKTDWMGSTYELKFATPQAMAAWVNEAKIGWIVMDNDTILPTFQHSKILQKAIDEGLLQARKITAVPHPGGEMILYSLPASQEGAPLSDALLPAISPGHIGGLSQ